MANFSLIIRISIIITIASTATAIGQDDAEGRRPMPPTSLRVFDVDSPDATVQTLNFYFDKYGAAISERDRKILHTILDDFSNHDLQYLATGTAPGLLGIKRGRAIVEAEWRPLVAAYASAILIDRSRASDRTWSIFLLIIGCALGILGTIGFEYLVKKRRAHDRND